MTREPGNGEPTDFVRLRPRLQLLEGDEDPAKDTVPAKGAVRIRGLLQKNFNRPQLPSVSLEYPLDCARRAEEGGYILVRQAIAEHHDSKIVASLRIYGKALEGRLKIEKWYREEAEHRRNLVPMEDARLLVCKGLNVIISNLVALPEKVGPACNPEAPAQAIAVLKAACANIIVDVKKSFPKEISEGIQWPEIF